ncbi:MAG: sigma-70 family RNA polymerase sigma factor [Anaerorhabdus sp.]|uniref:sigma-70 family RNA polymerase sigma factor n=1 Tax=Anaerorhabdus sp. TaxID=1872524 RepID=UPI002FCCA188
MKNELLIIYKKSQQKEEGYKRRHQRKQIYFSSDYDFGKISNQFKILKNTLGSELDKKECNSELYKTMNNLTTYEKKVIILYYFFDKTTVAIADEFGITQQAISKTKKRALNKMSSNPKLRELYLCDY